MRRILPLLILALLCPAAFAWNVTGHEIVAAEAYDLLKQDHPKTLAKVLAALRKHPLYDKMFSGKVTAVPSADQDQWLMMIAARWPDDVRRGPAGYSHPTWHYVDFPITLPGDPTQGPPPEVPNALESLAGQVAVLRGNNPEPDKAVAVCWIEHLVGDLHQPLHCCSLFSIKHPKGDRGGNDTFVRFGTKRTIDLHSLWDETLGTDAKFAPASRIATELLTRPDLARAKLKESADLEPKHWAKESYDVALHVTYADGKITGGTAEAGQELPDDYGKTAKAAAERRVALAGHRLEAVLVNMFGE